MLVVTIETCNAAFGDTMVERLRETARILREAADKVERDGFENGVPLRDLNGNTVGCINWRG